MEVIISLPESKIKTLHEAEKLHKAMTELKQWIEGKFSINTIHRIDSDDLMGKFSQIVRENEITCL